MSWEKMKLKELYEVHNGLSKGGKFFGSGYPFLTFSTVFNNYFIPDEITDFVQSTEKEQENYSIKRGDVFITRTSETSNELGMSCVALKNYPKATYNGFTKRMRPITDKLLPEYVGYYMRLPSFRAGFRAFSTMTTRASLRNEDLLSLQIAIPPIHVQEKIARILGAYDDLIENNKKQIQLLEEMAQRLYKEWFVDLHFPGYEKTKIVDGVPEGWSRKKIEEIVVTSSGGTPSRNHTEYYENGTHLWVKTKELNDGYIFDTEEKITDEAIKKSSAKYFKRGSIVLAMYGATIGKIGIATQNMTCNQACCVFDVSTFDNGREYLYCWLIESRKFLISQGKGAAQSNLSQQMIKNFNIIIPNSNLLKSFSGIMSPCFDLKRKLQKQNMELIISRNCLLPKLMRGELVV